MLQDRCLAYSCACGGLGLPVQQGTWGSAVCDGCVWDRLQGGQACFQLWYHSATCYAALYQVCGLAGRHASYHPTAVVHDSRYVCLEYQAAGRYGIGQVSRSSVGVYVEYLVLDGFGIDVQGRWCNYWQ